MKLPDNADAGTREDFAIEKFRLAKRFLLDAHTAFQSESNNTAVNRAYYAVFKVVTAVQSLEQKKFRSHGQAIGDFNREYIHEKKLFPEKFGGELHKIMKLRHTSDYEEFDNPTDEKTKAAISFAEEFFIALKRYCENLMGREIDVNL